MSGRDRCPSRPEEALFNGVRPVQNPQPFNGFSNFDVQPNALAPEALETWVYPRFKIWGMRRGAESAENRDAAGVELGVGYEVGVSNPPPQP